MRQRRLLIVAVALLLLLAFAAGMVSSRKRQPPYGPTEPSRPAIARLLAAPLADAAGKPASFAQWRGKPLIVNFWATWCPPCVREIPSFSRLQQKHPNVQFVGIAADSAENVQSFVARQGGLSYPVVLLAGDVTGLMAELGNPRGALPFTLILDAAGEARQLRLGTLSEAEAESIIAELSGS